MWSRNDDDDVRRIELHSFDIKPI
ncbi:unnamed protein product, partial [Rotaria sp. Silwood1]